MPMMPLVPPVVLEAATLNPSEVVGIAGFASVTVTGLIWYMAKQSDNHAKADERFAQALQEVTRGMHAAVDSLREARHLLQESHL